MFNSDIDGLVPRVPFDRRTFVKAVVGGGFAAAALPIAAQTIHTDGTGLDAGEQVELARRHRDPRDLRCT